MALRVDLSGKVIDIESKPWQFNGREGVSHTVYVRSGAERDGATAVRVDFAQLSGFAIGEDVTVPVDVSAQGSDFGPPKLSIKLDRDYRHVPAKHGSPAPGAKKDPAPTF